MATATTLFSCDQYAPFPNQLLITVLALPIPSPGGSQQLTGWHVMEIKCDAVL